MKYRTNIPYILSGNMGRIAKDQLSDVGKNHQICYLESVDCRNARCSKQWQEWRSGLLDGRYERRLSNRKRIFSVTKNKIKITKN
jgi:hypothetical protein